MGAPKQKWTTEEEAALKTGIARYGAGQWKTILIDPEFNAILIARSNIDLKDKWRNMNATANGLGSRQRARHPLKNNQPNPRPASDTSIVPRANSECHMEIVEVMPLAILNGPLQNGSSEKPIPRLDSLILGTITNLKEPRGSSRTAIAAYVERYPATPNLERLLAAELKLLTDNGKLIKVKHQYMIAPTPSSFDLRKNPFPLLLAQKKMGSARAETNTTRILTIAKIDAELEEMKSMTKSEAAAVAARAVAKAEAAVAKAEEAEREAEVAEAEAEVAKAFAAAANKALNCPALRHDCQHVPGRIPVPLQLDHKLRVSCVIRLVTVDIVGL